MTNNKPIESYSKSAVDNSPLVSSFRELLESLSNEQIRNQELLASLAFSLRSFTNLERFLELVPVVLTRLLSVDGALLIPFHFDGQIWTDQVQILPLEQAESFFSQVTQFAKGFDLGFTSNEQNLLSLDAMVQSHMGDIGVEATSSLARGRTRARLYVFNTKSKLVWSDINRGYLQVIADLTGVAIENDLFLQESRRHETVDRQVSTGAEIQAQLLPDYCPVIEGIQLAAECRPAFQVGGDYYDFMPTRPELSGRRRERGRWAFVVGDVMGKGIPAGLLMTMLRGMLRAEVLSGLPPDRILHDLNQLALDDLTQSHRFVTLFYSDYDPRSKRLRFANAAHNPPLLWRAEKNEIFRLDAPGLLIGLQPDANYVCGEITLMPGDVLLYYTDGVTEALGMAGERFTEKRLIALLQQASQECLAAKDILQKLFKRLDSFVGKDQHLEDDASMVVLKVNDALKLPHLSNNYPDKS